MSNTEKNQSVREELNRLNTTNKTSYYWNLAIGVFLLILFASGVITSFISIITTEECKIKWYPIKFYVLLVVILIGLLLSFWVFQRLFKLFQANNEIVNRRVKIIMDHYCAQEIDDKSSIIKELETEIDCLKKENQLICGEMIQFICNTVTAYDQLICNENDSLKKEEYNKILIGCYKKLIENDLESKKLDHKKNLIDTYFVLAELEVSDSPNKKNIAKLKGYINTTETYYKQIPQSESNYYVSFVEKLMALYDKVNDETIKSKCLEIAKNIYNEKKALGNTVFIKKYESVFS